METLTFICGCGARFADPLALYEHHQEAHSHQAVARAKRLHLFALRRECDQRLRATRQVSAPPTPPPPAPPPPPPPAPVVIPPPLVAGAPARAVPPPSPLRPVDGLRPFPAAVGAVWVPPRAPGDPALARARARIAARHGVAPCARCGTAKGATDPLAGKGRPFRDDQGRCAACHQIAVLYAQTGRMAGD